MSRKRIYVILTVIFLSSVVIGLSFAGLCDFCTETYSSTPGNFTNSSGGVDYCVCYWEFFGGCDAACCTDVPTIYDCDDIIQPRVIPYICNYKTVASHNGAPLSCYKKCNSIGGSGSLYCGAWYEIDKGVGSTCQFESGYLCYLSLHCR